MSAGHREMSQVERARHIEKAFQTPVIRYLSNGSMLITLKTSSREKKINILINEKGDITDITPDELK